MSSAAVGSCSSSPTPATAPSAAASCEMKTSAGLFAPSSSIIHRRRKRLNPAVSEFISLLLAGTARRQAAAPVPESEAAL